MIKNVPKFQIQKFWNYAIKVFQIPVLINALTDDRTGPMYPLAMVVIMLLMMFVLQYASMHQFLSKRSGQQTRLKHLLGHERLKRLPKRDVLQNVASKLHVDELKGILLSIVKKLKTNKVFEKNAIGGLRVAAIDGIDTDRSTKKSCDKCLHKKLKDGMTEFFHRFVVIMSIGAKGHFALSFTMLTPRDGEEKQEGELTGAKRLIKELYDALGRFADVIVCDALYFNAPFINAVRELGMHIVVRLEDETRKAYKEAVNAIRTGHYHKSVFQAKNAAGHLIEVTACEVRQVAMTGLKQGFVRIVKFVEHDLEASGAKDVVVWLATTSDDTHLKILWEIMHSRWQIENNCFRQLAVAYSGKHRFCHRAIEQLFAIMLIAFNLREAYLFLLLGRSFPTSGYTRIDVTRELEDDLFLNVVHIPGLVIHRKQRKAVLKRPA